MIRFWTGRKETESKNERKDWEPSAFPSHNKESNHTSFFSSYFAFLLLPLPANDSAIFQNGENGKNPGTNWIEIDISSLQKKQYSPYFIIILQTKEKIETITQMCFLFAFLSSETNAIYCLIAIAVKWLRILRCND